MHRRALLAFFLPILVVASVGRGAGAADRGGAALPPALLNAEWSLVTMQVGGRAAENTSGAGMSLTFAADGSLSGSGGCNRFFGGYTGDDAGKLAIAGPLGSTLIACEQAIAEREARYLAALPEVRGYSVDGAGRLVLRFDQADRQLVYTRTPGSLPQSGGGWGAGRSGR